MVGTFMAIFVAFVWLGLFAVLLHDQGECPFNGSQ